MLNERTDGCVEHITTVSRGYVLVRVGSDAFTSQSFEGTIGESKNKSCGMRFLGENVHDSLNVRCTFVDKCAALGAPPAQCALASAPARVGQHEMRP